MTLSSTVRKRLGWTLAAMYGVLLFACLTVLYVDRVWDGARFAAIAGCVQSGQGIYSGLRAAKGNKWGSSVSSDLPHLFSSYQLKS